MPIYEYHCSKCDHKLEALQKFSDVPLSECPACLQQGLRKLVSAPSFRLKGGGWYETDFKTGDKKQLAESESATKADSGSSDESSKSTGNEEQGKKEKDQGEKDKRESGKAEQGKTDSPDKSVVNESKKETKNKSESAASKPTTKAAES